MDLRLFSIESAPRTLPVWDLILDDLGRPPPARLARVLGVGRSTVCRWTADRSAPRMACLALFWLTRWGRSEVDCRATNDAMTAVALARSLHEERQQLRANLERLQDDHQRLQSMLSRLASSPGRGNESSACLSRTDTVSGAWLDAAPGLPTPTPQALGWPELDLARLAQAVADWPALDVLPAPGACAGPGSPAAPPGAAHSTRCPGDPHRRQPRFSGPEEASPSSPSTAFQVMPE